MEPVPVEFVVPDLQRGDDRGASPGGQAHIGAGPEHPSHLAQRRLGLGHVEQHERHYHHVVRGRHERQLRRIGNDPWAACWGAAQHALGPIGGDHQRGRRGASKGRQQRSDTCSEIEHLVGRAQR